MELTIEKALQKGVAAHKEGKLQDAEKLYRAILQSQPTHPDANHNLGILAVSVNKTEAALPFFKTALEANPRIEQFWLSYIDALIKEQQFDNAKQVLEQAKKQCVDADRLNSLEAQLSPKTQKRNTARVNPPQELLNSLLEHYQNGRFSIAEELAVSITQDFPKHQYAWKVLGAVLGATGRKSEALDANQTAVSLSPKDAAAHSNLGVTLQELGRLDEAETSCRKAIALNPDFAEAHNNLGNSLQELGKLDEAEASYIQAIALKSNYAEAHYNLGSTLKELGILDEAEASLRKAIDLKPDYADAHNNLGNTLKELGRLHEAEASYNQVIASKPNFAEAHSNLGNTLKKLGRLDEAEKSCRQAIALKPDYAEAHNNLGNLLQGLGRLNAAEASLRKAIELKPDYADAHNNLGTILIALGLRESALKHFQISLELVRGVKPLNPKHKSFVSISKAKIDHDIEQFKYLADSGYDTTKFNELAALYKSIALEIDSKSDTEVVPLSDKHRGILGDTYNRPFHINEAPLLDEPTVNKNLNVHKITNDYFSHDFGLTYIDEFLSPKALASLRDFLLGSTIWFDFFHGGGYMGTYLKDGLASPLILQIAEELRLKFPKIFKHHKLMQLWAYKYDSRARDKTSFDGISAHADFAAINVNFWITPNSANLNKLSGGLVVYNTEAPKEWDFKTYNSDDKRIREEIAKHEESKCVIPYNENRAVIFNSNLFHETDNIDFKDGYENRRINVTMLFGEREL